VKASIAAVVPLQRTGQRIRGSAGDAVAQGAGGDLHPRSIPRGGSRYRGRAAELAVDGPARPVVGVGHLRSTNRSTGSLPVTLPTTLWLVNGRAAVVTCASSTAAVRTRHQRHRLPVAVRAAGLESRATELALQVPHGQGLAGLARAAAEHRVVSEHAQGAP
jgi:hypothetical protein